MPPNFHLFLAQLSHCSGICIILKTYQGHRLPYVTAGNNSCRTALRLILCKIPALPLYLYACHLLPNIFAIFLKIPSATSSKSIKPQSLATHILHAPHCSPPLLIQIPLTDVILTLFATVRLPPENTIRRFIDNNKSIPRARILDISVNQSQISGLVRAGRDSGANYVSFCVSWKRTKQ